MLISDDMTLSVGVLYIVILLVILPYYNA